MATVRKVTKINISKAPAKEEASATKEVVAKEAPSTSESSAGRDVNAPKVKKVCQFCENKTEPHYWDASALRRFVNDRGRIVSRSRNGSCSKHQRRVAREVKHARHLALLPFVVRA